MRQIFLPGPNGTFSTMVWTGTLKDSVGSDDLSDKIRMVIAFDN